MPLRDHFRAPLDDQRHWEGLHVTWPVMIVAHLRRTLPRRCFAEPKVHSGSSAEIDVATVGIGRELRAELRYPEHPLSGNRFPRGPRCMSDA
jgi:hypothetical protein